MSLIKLTSKYKNLKCACRINNLHLQMFILLNANITSILSLSACIFVNIIIVYYIITNISLILVKFIFLSHECISL
jgi:hypothetical protein